MKTKYYVDESEQFNYDHYRRMNKAQNDYSLRGYDALTYKYIKERSPQSVLKVQSLFKGIEDRGQIWNISNFLKKYGLTLLGSSLLAMNTAFGLKEYNSQIALTLAELSTPLLELGALTGVFGAVGQKIVEKLNERDINKSKNYLRNRLVRIVEMEKDYDSVRKTDGDELISKTEKEFSETCKGRDVKISLRQVIKDGESCRKYSNTVSKMKHDYATKDGIESDSDVQLTNDHENDEYVELELDN